MNLTDSDHRLIVQALQIVQRAAAEDEPAEHLLAREALLDRMAQHTDGVMDMDTARLKALDGSLRATGNRLAVMNAMMNAVLTIADLQAAGKIPHATALRTYADARVLLSDSETLSDSLAGVLRLYEEVQDKDPGA